MRSHIAFGDGLGMKVAYSNAMAVDLTETKRMVWVSGQLALNNEGELVGKGNVEIQTEQCIKNVQALLEEFGGTLKDVVEVTVFVKDMSTLPDIHKVRLKYFQKPYPTSTLVEISNFALPEALIEIEASAVIDIQ